MNERVLKIGNKKDNKTFLKSSAVIVLQYGAQVQNYGRDPGAKFIQRRKMVQEPGT